MYSDGQKITINLAKELRVEFEMVSIVEKYESSEDAIYRTILTSGLPLKTIALTLWPTMKSESAVSRLRASLIADRREKLTFDEIIKICQLCGRFDPLYFMAQELSHERPARLLKEKQAAQIVEEMHSLSHHLQQLVTKVVELEKVK